MNERTDPGQKLIDEAIEMYELIHHSDQTKLLYSKILSLADLEHATECSSAFEWRVVHLPDGSTRLETMDERRYRLDKTEGYLNGVMFIPSALRRYINIAKRELARQERENGQNP